MGASADGAGALRVGVVVVADSNELVPELPIGKIGTWVSDDEGILKGSPIRNNGRYHDKHVACRHAEGYGI